jgi:hypothetical protein
VRLAGVGVHLQRTVYVAAARSHIQALRDGQLRRWAQLGPKFGALTPFAPGDLRSAAMGCALMGAWTCALGRLNSGPSRLERPFVDKPVPGAPSLLIRSRPRASGLVVEPEILAPVRPLTVGVVQEK